MRPPSRHSTFETGSRKVPSNDSSGARGVESRSCGFRVVVSVEHQLTEPRLRLCHPASPQRSVSARQFRRGRGRRAGRIHPGCRRQSLAALERMVVPHRGAVETAPRRPPRCGRTHMPPPEGRRYRAETSGAARPAIASESRMSCDTARSDGRTRGVHSSHHATNRYSRWLRKRVCLKNADRSMVSNGFAALATYEYGSST